MSTRHPFGRLRLGILVLPGPKAVAWMHPPYRVISGRFRCTWISEGSAGHVHVGQALAIALLVPDVLACTLGMRSLAHPNDQETFHKVVRLRNRYRDMI